MTTEPTHLPAARENRDRAPAVMETVRAAALSLPGKLLGLSVAFVLLAEVLIFFPSAANFRTEWLMDRADAAHLAALAAENASEMGLGEAMVGELLDGAEVVAVSRVYDGVNELVLGGAIGDAKLITANVTQEGFFDRILAACHTFLAPDGRFVRIIAVPRTRPDELISVIVPEAGLKADLYAYSRNIFWLSIFIALVTGGLIYVVLLFILVRPMRKLARAMTAFQSDPGNPTRTVVPSGRHDEIGEAEAALAAMQTEVRDAFRQRERLAALGGAVARINHDLRNVLASAQLVSDRLAMSKDERVSAMGARLVRAVDRGIRLCQDTLQYGRSDERPPELQRLALAPALDDAAGDAFASTGAADWENTIDALVVVEADPDHVHRIFLNLIRNAVQAMAQSDPRALSVSTEIDADTGFVAVLVQDTGPGVPDRIRETLFEPFGRTGSKGGSGLGLSIARDLARAMGGDARLKATSDAGSVFEVTLKAG